MQSGAQNKIRVEFKFKETLKPLTTDYLKRSETLDFRMSNMRETLFNQIRESEFELIVSLGKGKSKFLDILLAETEAFEPGKTILYLLIHLMESKGMVIILHSTRGR